MIAETRTDSNMKIMNILAAILLPSTIVWAAEPTQKIPCDELRQTQLIRQPGLILIDVRPPDDSAEGGLLT